MSFTLHVPTLAWWLILAAITLILAVMLRFWAEDEPRNSEPPDPEHDGEHKADMRLMA